MTRQPLQIHQLDDDLPTLDDFSPENDFNELTGLPSSISMENFTEIDSLWSDMPNINDDPFQRAATGLARSESAFIQISQWDPFSDNPF
ncbi:hypothetical protein GPJ56_008176 [Histomonas meleagridis]|uniref:uncharacterized protein n=1 Tax=Histomonas meleagridis TaxID=135588 RepID=UPI003559A2EE|nr:hypothetical protein GPJ56_008176 [Histomonas meleagridis]KAH0797197.1 hypothetical protein GO595_009879 [Histomonas meleagridis]